jgi:CRP-like cAMP-binding protein
MFDQLYSTLSMITQIPISEWIFLAKKIKTKSLKKDEHLFRLGEHSEIIAFVSKGFVYSYYTSPKNEELVKKFCWEGRLTSPYVSFLNGRKECMFSCKALEKTFLFYINYTDMLEMYQRHECWQKLGRLLAEKSIIEREEREYESLCLASTERYLSFVQKNAKHINRIPQYLVASYLGITPISLSRIRKSLSQKKTKESTSLS